MEEVVGYIMYYDLLKDDVRGSFFSKIDECIKIAKKFLIKYPETFNWEDVDLDWEEEIVEFVKDYFKK
jgi:hypothetical protein